MWWEFFKDIGQGIVEFGKTVAPIFYWYCLIAAVIYLVVFIYIVCTNGWPLWDEIRRRLRKKIP